MAPHYSINLRYIILRWTVEFLYIKTYIINLHKNISFHFLTRSNRSNILIKTRHLCALIEYRGASDTVQYFQDPYQ